jgi:Ice-binding-like
MIPRNARLAFLISLAASVLACTPSSAASLTSREEAALMSGASSAPSVGAAGNFAVLAGTAVTCTNGTITGNVGVSPGTAITQTSCPVTGTINAGNAAAVQANSDFFIAYDKFKALACDRTLTTFDSQTLSPGVYCVDAAATFTDAVLTLSGPANGLWIFKIGNLGTGALTGTRFSVVTPSGAPPPCNNVFWWVAQAATMTDSKFVGSILAGAAISLTRGTFSGDAFAKAAVTITGTAVTACAIGNAAARVCKDRDRDKDKCRCECKDKDKDHADKDKKHADDDDECDDDDDHDGDNHHGRHEEHGR